MRLPLNFSLYYSFTLSQYTGRRYWDFSFNINLWLVKPAPIRPLGEVINNSFNDDLTAPCLDSDYFNQLYLNKIFIQLINKYNN